VAQAAGGGSCSAQPGDPGCAELLSRFLGRPDALRVELAQSTPAKMGEMGERPVQDGGSPLAARPVPEPPELVRPLESGLAMSTFNSRDLRTRSAV